MPGQQTSGDRPEGDGDHLREQGLRPIQVWVPDTRSPGFAAEAHRQSLLVAESPQAEENQAFVDSISDQLTD